MSIFLLSGHKEFLEWSQGLLPDHANTAHSLELLAVSFQAMKILLLLYYFALFYTAISAASQQPMASPKLSFCCQWIGALKPSPGCISAGKVWACAQLFHLANCVQVLTFKISPQMMLVDLVQPVTQLTCVSSWKMRPRERMD